MTMLMMMMRKVTLLVLLVVFGWSSGAWATTFTLTFDALPTGDIAPFTENGYMITTDNYPNHTYNLAIQNVGGANQNVFLDATPENVFGTQMIIQRIDGTPFSLVSLDIANLAAGSSPVAAGTSACAGGGYRMEIQGAPTGGCHLYTPNSSTFTTISPIDLTDITQLQVRLVSRGSLIHAVDNIVLSSIPEPSTALLLGLGLIGFSASKRRPASRI